jgi:hypothetical protein
MPTENGPRHCPLCNGTAINGQGAVHMDGSTLVQYRCRGCGELFFGPDKRGSSAASTGEPQQKYV